MGILSSQLGDPNSQYASDQRSQYGSASGQNMSNADYNVSKIYQDIKIQLKFNTIKNKSF